MKSNLRILRDHSRNWWYHRQLRSLGDTTEARKREHYSVRSDIRSLRSCLENNGYATVGTYGMTLHHHRNSYTSIPGVDEELLQLWTNLHIPIFDSRTFNEPTDIIRLPLLNPWAPDNSDHIGPLSYVDYPTYLARFKAVGGTIINEEFLS